ncbi:A24 family peptidase [Thiofaba sp. EF100]|uniref:prepilin peptidase n=1 Tax=Thiofaba sp. EF100 TaxID=3121274 RepID=UPI003221942A
MDALLHALETSPVLLYTSLAVLGLMVGSFLNVVILRLPKMLEARWKAECQEFLGQPVDEADGQRFNLAIPASHCPACGHALRWWENLPLISYLWLRGRCAHCKTRISPQYPLVEAASAGLTVLTASQVPFGWPLLLALVFVWVLLALTVIDLNTMLLPDQLTLPLLWLGLLLNVGGLFASLPDAVIGAAAGYLALWAVYHGFRLLTGKEGMGYGDFKLLGALGAWMGWQALPGVILLSSLVGAVIGIGLMLLRGRDKNTPIPFGPYLAIAGLIWFFWGDAITALYLGGGLRP